MILSRCRRRRTLGGRSTPCEAVDNPVSAPPEGTTRDPRGGTSADGKLPQGGGARRKEVPPRPATSRPFLFWLCSSAAIADPLCMTLSRRHHRQEGVEEGKYDRESEG